MSDNERLVKTQEILDYIEKNNIYYIADLWCYAKDESADDWFPILSNKKTYSFMKFYLNEKH